MSSKEFQSTGQEIGRFVWFIPVLPPHHSRIQRKLDDLQNNPIPILYSFLFIINISPFISIFEFE